jgi:hypothetical protein
MEPQEKVDYAISWFGQLPEDKKTEAVRQLFAHAILSDWINVWSPEDRKEMIEDEGRSQAEVDAPYFRTCAGRRCESFGTV